MVWLMTCCLLGIKKRNLFCQENAFTASEMSAPSRQNYKIVYSYDSLQMCKFNYIPNMLRIAKYWKIVMNILSGITLQ